MVLIAVALFLLIISSLLHHKGMYNVEFTMYNGNKMLKSAHGFTLVELLVVMAVMAIVGVFTLANYKSFGEDQNFKNAALDVQSFLRLAQSNSTSGLKCQSQDTLGWIVVFTNATELDLECQNSSGITSSLKKLSLPADISISGITTGISNCPFGTTVTFAPLYGTMVSSCGSSSIIITLLNSKTSNTKQVIVEQGGRIYAQ